MGEKYKNQATRVEYATKRMDIALKRMMYGTDEDWEQTMRWATAWGKAARPRKACRRTKLRV
jgi:hypothetical protein